MNNLTELWFLRSTEVRSSWISWSTDATNHTHLNDPVSCLNAGSHRSSIYNTVDRAQGNGGHKVLRRDGEVEKTRVFALWAWVLLSLTSCTNTGLSPLTVSPKPFSSLWIITHLWTRPGNTQQWLTLWDYPSPRYDEQKIHRRALNVVLFSLGEDVGRRCKWYKVWFSFILKVLSLSFWYK